MNITFSIIATYTIANLRIQIENNVSNFILNYTFKGKTNSLFNNFIIIYTQERDIFRYMPPIFSRIFLLLYIYINFFYHNYSKIL